jgi:hypothetical protein
MHHNINIFLYIWSKLKIFDFSKNENYIDCGTEGVPILTRIGVARARVYGRARLLRSPRMLLSLPNVAPTPHVATRPCLSLRMHASGDHPRPLRFPRARGDCIRMRLLMLQHETLLQYTSETGETFAIYVCNICM